MPPIPKLTSRQQNIQRSGDSFPILALAWLPARQTTTRLAFRPIRSQAPHSAICHSGRRWSRSR